MRSEAGAVQVDQTVALERHHPDVTHCLDMIEKSAQYRLQPVVAEHHEIGAQGALRVVPDRRRHDDAAIGRPADPCHDGGGFVRPGGPWNRRTDTQQGFAGCAQPCDAEDAAVGDHRILQGGRGEFLHRRQGRFPVEIAAQLFTDVATAGDLGGYVFQAPEFRLERGRLQFQRKRQLVHQVVRLRAVQQHRRNSAHQETRQQDAKHRQQHDAPFGRVDRSGLGGRRCSGGLRHSWRRTLERPPLAAGAPICEGAQGVGTPLSRCVCAPPPRAIA